MRAIDAIKAAAADAGVPITHIGRAMGKRDNYVSVVAYKGADPSAGTAAAMLEVIGYNLCAVPHDSVPPDAITIDPPDRGDGDV